MRDKRLTVLVEGALMIAVAFALSFVKIWQAPQGGSVTLGSMIPILLFAARRGPRAGILAGTAYGVLQFVIEPYFVHPAQVLLDYPLAFGALGLAGFFGEDIVKGISLGVFGRALCHFVSGVVFFAQYAKGNVYLYSAVYQAGYLVPELLISLVVMRLGLYSLIKKAKV